MICYIFVAPNGATANSCPAPPHCRSFTITLRHTTLGRTPLNELSAQRSDLYLTIHNTHNRHTCPWRDSYPQSQQTSCRRHTSWPRGHRDRPLIYIYIYIYIMRRKCKKRLCQDDIRTLTLHITSCKHIQFRQLVPDNHGSSAEESRGYGKVWHRSVWKEQQVDKYGDMVEW